MQIFYYCKPSPYQRKLFSKNSILSVTKYTAVYPNSGATETALLRVTNDIILNINNQRVSLLVLLDISATFNTIKNFMLLTSPII